MGRLLDLFCGAGGAAVGYHRAGFTDIVGVDIKPQPNYPFRFFQADALEVLMLWPTRFDAIHASPTCQLHSKTRAILRGKGLVNPGVDHIAETRRRLVKRGVPFVIENVPGAPLVNPITLCGTMFGLRVYRHRLFESSVCLMAPDCGGHVHTTGSHRGYSKGTPFITVGGNNYSRVQGAAAMGIDWPMTRAELSQAIPPAYTEFVGRQLIAQLQESCMTDPLANVPLTEIALSILEQQAHEAAQQSEYGPYFSPATMLRVIAALREARQQRDEWRLGPLVGEE